MGHRARPDRGARATPRRSPSSRRARRRASRSTSSASLHRPPAGTADRDLARRDRGLRLRACSAWSASRPIRWPAASTSCSPTSSSRPGSQGQDLDLATLVGPVPTRRCASSACSTSTPSSRPPTARSWRCGSTALLASPSFAAWRPGPAHRHRRRCCACPTAGRAPRSISLAHLSDEERQFVVTLVLGRAHHLDAPPARHRPTCGRSCTSTRSWGSCRPPPCRRASRRSSRCSSRRRAFGVGMVLATQNPVDLDYKAVANAGTWMIGRLQTEQRQGPPARRHALGGGRRRRRGA